LNNIDPYAPKSFLITQELSKLGDLRGLKKNSNGNIFSEGKHFVSFFLEATLFQEATQQYINRLDHLPFDALDIIDKAMEHCIPEKGIYIFYAVSS